MNEYELYLEKHHRRSIRLKGYDYTQAGAYYFTICCYHRRCLLGEIKDGVTDLNLVGTTVKAVWESLPHHFPLIELDAFVVMPNHVHGIIVITDKAHNYNHNGNCRGEAFVPRCNDTQPGFLSTNASPFSGCNSTSLPRGTQSGSIGAIVQNFKSVATRRVNRITPNSGTLWQRNYHEEIIRNEKAYENIRRYIQENALNWDGDEENPSNR
jgi:REP element-mobilizing transposase RayT